ncbi:ribosome silencing factor [bacterium]|nr:ribosome silencing factor [bacterium]
MQEAFKEKGFENIGDETAQRSSEPDSMEDVLALVADAAADKLAEDLCILDVTGFLDYADYVAVCQGQTPIQNRAIADRIIEVLKGYDIILSSLQGYRAADWILIDYDTFVVHIFSPEAREFYQLEELYSEGRKVEFG